MIKKSCFNCEYGKIFHGEMTNGDDDFDCINKKADDSMISYEIEKGDFVNIKTSEICENIAEQCSQYRYKEK